MDKNILMSNDIYDPHSRFDSSNEIHPTAIIYDNVTMGKNNIIGAYSVIGSNGEIRGARQSDFKGTVSIGNGNVISEHVTIQRPLNPTVTEIGNNNLIMAHAHLGHDCIVGNDTEICTGVILGGYSVVEDGAKALVGLGSAVVKDVAAESVVVGNPAKPMVK